MALSGVDSVFIKAGRAARTLSVRLKIHLILLWDLRVLLNLLVHLLAWLADRTWLHVHLLTWLLLWNLLVHLLA